MVYLSSRPLTQSEFDSEEICPGLLVWVDWRAARVAVYAVSRYSLRETGSRLRYGTGDCVRVVLCVDAIYAADCVVQLRGAQTTTTTR